MTGDSSARQSEAVAALACGALLQVPVPVLVFLVLLLVLLFVFVRLLLLRVLRLFYDMECEV